MSLKREPTRDNFLFSNYFLFIRSPGRFLAGSIITSEIGHLFPLLAVPLGVNPCLGAAYFTGRRETRPVEHSGGQDRLRIRYQAVRDFVIHSSAPVTNSLTRGNVPKPVTLNNQIVFSLVRGWGGRKRTRLFSSLDNSA